MELQAWLSSIWYDCPHRKNILINHSLQSHIIHRGLVQVPYNSFDLVSQKRTSMTYSFDYDIFA